MIQIKTQALVGSFSVLSSLIVNFDTFQVYFHNIYSAFIHSFIFKLSIHFSTTNTSFFPHKAFIIHRIFHSAFIHSLIHPFVKSILESIFISVPILLFILPKQRNFIFFRMPLFFSEKWFKSSKLRVMKLSRLKLRN